MTSLVAGLVLGLAGSGHCASMCGPLVLTIGRSLGRISRRMQLQNAALYHGGRLIVYMAMAVPAGAVGQALAIRGFGRTLAIVTALLLLASAVDAIKARWFGPVGRVATAVASRACTVATRWRLAHPIAGPVMAGAANGLLPCGLVYAALMTAAAMGTTGHAVLLMLGFGVGTLPVLLAVSISAAWVPLTLRVRLRRLTPVVLALTAALLIIRSLAQPSNAPHHHHASALGAFGERNAVEVMMLSALTPHPDPRAD